MYRAGSLLHMFSSSFLASGLLSTIGLVTSAPEQSLNTRSDELFKTRTCFNSSFF